MNKFLRTLVILLVFVSSVFAQENTTKSTVFLKNGDRFTGQILMRTDEVIVMQTDDGRRFQFQALEIDRVLQQEKVSEEKPVTERSNFSGIIDLEGGLAYVSIPGFQYSPVISGTVALGTPDFFISKTFAGLGAGVEIILTKNPGENLLFLPVFIQLNKTLGNKSISPFVGSKAGYSFGVNKEYKGGVFIKLSGGANFSLSGKTSLNLGLFGKIQQISGTVIERNELGEFQKQGTTPLYSMGVNLAFIF